jgi:hypothetical protein
MHVTSLEEDSLVVFYHLVHQKSVLIRGVAFGEIGLIRGVTSLEDNLVVFYHLVHQKSVLIREVTFGEIV